MKNKNCKLINNSGKNIKVLLPSAAFIKDKGSGTTEIFTQNYKLLKIGNNDIVASGSTGNLILDQQYTDDKGKIQDALIYDLIISKEDTFFPVANKSEMKPILAPDSDPFPDAIITTDDTEAMEQAAKFHQAISAYPTSKLAEDYRQALDDSKKSGLEQADGSADSSNNIADAMAKTVDDFFKGTKAYEKVNLASLVAVQSYYRNFPFIWSNQGKAEKYYLYGNNGGKVNFIGIVSISGTIDLRKSNGGYECSFIPALNPSDLTKTDVDSNKKKALIYLDGLFVDDANVDIPSIAVSGSFQLKTKFTQVASDNQIVAVIAGTINGASCVGFNEPQDKYPPTNSNWFDEFNKWLGLIMMYIFARCKSRSKKGTSKDELENKNKELEAKNKDIDGKNFKKQTGNKENIPEDPQSELNANKEVIDQFIDANKIAENLERQAKDLETIAEFIPDMNQEQIKSLEKIAQNLKDSAQKIRDASNKDIKDIVAEAKNNMKEGIENLSTLEESISNKISSEAKENLKESVDTQKEIKENMDEREKEIEERIEDKSAEEGDFELKGIE